MQRLLITLMALGLVSTVNARSSLMGTAQHLSTTMQTACVQNKKITIPVALGVAWVSTAYAHSLRKQRAKKRLNGAGIPAVRTVSRAIASLELPALLSSIATALTALMVAAVTVQAESPQGGPDKPTALDPAKKKKTKEELEKEETALINSFVEALESKDPEKLADFLAAYD